MIKLRIYPVRDAKGAYVGNVLEWLDVGEAQINAGTLDSLRQNQILVEYDMEGRVAKGNTRFCRSFGFSEDEAVGKRFADLFEEPAHAKAIWDEVRSGGFRTEKTRRRNKNGDYVCIESSISLVKDNTGKPYRIIEIGADVTEIEAAAMEARRRREEMEQSQKHVVAELRRGLAALSHGDLSVTLDQRFASEYEELRSDFNATVTTLMTTLQQLMDVARNIRNGTVEISQAADDLSRRTENQAATLEETAAALEEMTESVRSAAEGASKADTIVKDARENAIASGNVVLEAVDAMNQIESSSKQISQIIGVIDDIAFQTNLLALNAGVEAARAGDAGRGFAVVASEVRALAQRSSDAAKEIKTLISQSSQHVETGVTLVGDAGGALQQIVENVSNISSLVSEIATSSREQSTGLGEINTGVNHLDQVTQQNAAMVEESTAASHSMKQEAENLASLIAVFNLGDGHHQVVAPKKADPKPPVKAAAKPAASSDWGTRKAVGSDVAPQTDWIEF
nr:methyl-accepting chemotaxis protein [Mesobacterium pallidum]